MNYREEQEAKTISRIQDIKNLLKDIKEILANKSETDVERKLELRVVKYKAEAETWEKAFNRLTSNDKPNDKQERASFGSQKPFTIKEAIEQESKAIDFVNTNLDDLFKENPPPKEGEIRPQGVWLAWAGRLLWEAVREEALTFIAKTLEELKEKAAGWAADLAKWLLEECQVYLYEKFQASHDEKEQKHFKDKIVDNFPESSLAKKLEDNK